MSSLSPLCNQLKIDHDFSSYVPLLLCLGLYSSSSERVACEYSSGGLPTGLGGAADCERDILGRGFAFGFGFGGLTDVALGILTIGQSVVEVRSIQGVVR
jgi:hypothetical protein